MNCTFPSKELVAESRRMGKLADSTNELQVSVNCAEFCQRVMQLRILHEEITGCGCWYRAVNEANAQESNEGSRDKREICERV